MKEAGENNYIFPERKKILSNFSCIHNFDEGSEAAVGDDPSLQQMTLIRNLALP